MSKAKKNPSSKNPKGGFDKPESLQAIVFADDFIHDLKPAQQIYPSILLPVVTAPLLDYLLETLDRSKVQQIFLYCSTHVEKIKAFVETKKTQFNKMTITTIISDGCRSLGDALRDIDTKGCIRGDFILIRGTAFAYVDLQSLMDLHKAKKEKDKNIAMTMILRNLGSVKDSAFKNESSLVVSNADTRKLLSYKKFVQSEKKIDLEVQLFLENDNVDINTGLIDTRIYLCSQSVLPLFADNFDFQTMEDFIHGVLMNEELLDTRIYWEPLPFASYALPIASWKAYQILSKDILQRYSYPLAPDTLPISLQHYIYMSRSTYKHRTSVLSKGSILHSESLIGEKSILGENSFINKSIIGPECTIGKEVKINNSFIISNVTIEDKCEINDSIIFSGCLLEKNKKLKACILLPKVKCKEDYSNTLIEIGDDGHLNCKKIEQRSNGCDFNFLSIFASDDCDEYNDDDASSSSFSASEGSSVSDDEDGNLPAFQDDNERFLSEVLDSLLRGYQDKLRCENLILEINSSRYAYNVSIQQVSFNVIRALLKLPIHCIPESITDSSAQTTEYYKILIKVLSYFRPIIVNYIKTEESQENCLQAIQDIAYTDKKIYTTICAQNTALFLSI